MLFPMPKMDKYGQIWTTWTAMDDMDEGGHGQGQFNLNFKSQYPVCPYLSIFVHFVHACPRRSWLSFSEN